jgi:probable rRNA maturation factor
MAPSRKLIEIEIKTPAWRKKWPKAAAEAQALLACTADWPSLKAKAGGDIAVIFADDATLKDLNARFRGKDRATNVLSFPDGERPPGGGIALAFETISAEAAAQGKPFVNHTKHMILHGFLHLLGFDHNQPRAAGLMEGLEIAILARMGIPNPYLIETKTRA